MIWYECMDCNFSTGRSSWADEHEDNTRHTVIDVSDEEED